MACASIERQDLRALRNPNATASFTSSCRIHDAPSFLTLTLTKSRAHASFTKPPIQYLIQADPRPDHHHNRARASSHLACDCDRTAQAPHRASSSREQREGILEHVGPTWARASARNERGHKWAAQRRAGAAWRHGGPAGRTAATECDRGGCAAEPAELEPDSEFFLFVCCWCGGVDGWLLWTGWLHRRVNRVKGWLQRM